MGAARSPAPATAGARARHPTERAFTPGRGQASTVTHCYTPLHTPWPGFDRECKAKHGAPIYEAFANVFQWLPLATIVNGTLAVLHGGIDSTLTMAGLSSAPRDTYVLLAGSASKPACFSSRAPGGGPIAPTKKSSPRKDPRDGADWLAARTAKAREEREARQAPINAVLWNDPMKSDGQEYNVGRGTGHTFGPDVLAAFLQARRYTGSDTGGYTGCKR